MKKTIFKKLFLTYGITIIIGFGILAILLLQLFNQYFVDSKKALMLEQGGKISQEIAAGLNTGQVNSQQLSNDLQILDKVLNARIWLVDREGAIIGVSDTNEEEYLGQTIGESQLAEIHQGKSYFQTGTFDNKLQEKSLTVGYPIFAGNIFEGGLFIHAPLTEIGRTFKDIYAMTVAAILLSCMIAYIILYFQIRKISRPLQEISAAAKEIAGGAFEKRLNIRTGDEIEMLGESFNHMAGSLENIEENRRNLVANISHDIRSPITAISGFAEGILDGTIRPEMQAGYLEKILSESKRLMKITDNLLDLNNLQEGHLVPDMQDFDVNEMIRRTILSFERQITGKKLNVNLVFSDDATFVYSDPTLLSRILTNIMENAVKFTPIHGNITVKADGTGERAVVSVLNDGVDLDSKQLDAIWERFHKGDASRGVDRNGFGLGLAIVKQMAALLEERVWASSGENQVKFSFTVKRSKNQ